MINHVRLCGIINKTGSEVESNLLHKMASTIHHRGPDEDGMMLREQCWLFS